MNREIIFRGIKVGTKGKWIIGGYFSNTDEEGLEHFIFEVYYGAIPVYDHTIGQFTGLKDKNGVDIYEGDICNFEIKGLGSGKSECYFIQGCFFLKVEGQQSPFPLFEYDNRSDIIIEILGNIHDNPNLLQ